MRIYIVILLIFTFSNYGHTRPDSLYIEPFSQKFAVQAYTEKNLLILNDEYTESYNRTYSSNNPMNLGLGLTINNTIISVGYGYGFDFMRDKSKGKTKSFDFQLHNFGQKYTFDIYIQKYKGFYMEEDKNRDQFILCPDLQIIRYGINTQYVFNNKKFSYKAAFNQSEKQLKSAGSFLVGIGAYYTIIESDSSLVINDKSRFKNFQFGISGGYAYNWVINKRYFISGSITTGINVGNESIDRIGKDKLEVYPIIVPRFATGYNTDKWSIGVSFHGNITFPALSDERNISIMSGNVQLKYIRRLEYIPILSKIFK